MTFRDYFGVIQGGMWSIMEFSEQRDRRRTEQSLKVALFRYLLIQDLVVPGMSARQRGRLVREIAESEHVDPTGKSVTVSRHTLDRWARAWRAGGFAALVPTPRQCASRTPAEIVQAAVALKEEKPERTAAQICRLLRHSWGWAPTERTLQRYFAERGLNLLPASQPGALGGFEARKANELWTGDSMTGPRVRGRETYLFAFVDDHSRAVVGYRFAFTKDIVRSASASAFRSALASRGVPDSIQVDHGGEFVDAWLLRACANLGVQLAHAYPGLPQGRTRTEAFFRVVREQFLVELDGAAGERITSLADLNWLFTAWVETVYHRAAHSETGQPPIERWFAAVPHPLPLPTPEQLREAFLWSEPRTVGRNATVSLHGDTLEVEAALAGLKVELVFDPFDPADIDVHHRGYPVGKAVAPVRRRMPGD